MDLSVWREELAAIDADVLSADQCASLVAELTQLRKACDAAAARLMVKAEAGYAHRRQGYLDAADWYATASGTTTAEARRAIDTASGVQSCPHTEQAWRSGQLSAAQVSEIVKTEELRPGSEAELLELAKARPLRVLKEQAQHRRLTAIDPDELRRRQHKARHLRHWRDDLGMIRISGALLPEDGATFVSKLDHATEPRRRAARRRGEQEPWEALAADAFMALMVQGEATPTSKSDVVFVCDLNAYRRGHVHNGEPCHVIDGGPVPVDAVKAAIADDAL